MQDLFIDVHLEVNPDVAAGQPDANRYLLELSRDTADRRCIEAGGRLRTDKAPEFVVSRVIDPLTGFGMLLVASRWAVVVPDAVRTS